MFFSTPSAGRMASKNQRVPKLSENQSLAGKSRENSLKCMKLQS